MIKNESNFSRPLFSTKKSQVNCDTVSKAGTQCYQTFPGYRLAQPEGHLRSEWRIVELRKGLKLILIDNIMISWLKVSFKGLCPQGILWRTQPWFFEHEWHWWWDHEEEPDQCCHTETEIWRNKNISKVRYKIEQYFGITHKYHRAGKARFATILKENGDHLCGAMAFNIKCVVLNLRKREMIIAI